MPAGVPIFSRASGTAHPQRLFWVATGNPGEQGRVTDDPEKALERRARHQLNLDDGNPGSWPATLSPATADYNEAGDSAT